MFLAIMVQRNIVPIAYYTEFFDIIRRITFPPKLAVYYTDLQLKNHLLNRLEYSKHVSVILFYVMIKRDSKF